MKKYTLVLSALLMLLVACTQSVNVKLDPEVTVFLSDASDKTMRLSEQNSEYVLLKEWLVTHKDNWLTTSGKYSGGVYLTSGEFGIQVTDSKVVLYTDITTTPTAIYAQEIERSELKSLKMLGK